MNAYYDTPFAMTVRPTEPAAWARACAGASIANPRHTLDLSGRGTGSTDAPVTRCRRR